jgi:hypothetical protein
LPQEEPAGENPPDGAIIDYYLSGESKTDATLEIIDSKGTIVRRFTSNDKPYDIPDVNIPLYWIRPQELLENNAGAHRFTWDLHYTPLDVPPSYPIAAIYHNTAPVYTSPWVMPGIYTIKLSVSGKVYTETLLVKMDPRVKMTMQQLQLQHDLSMDCYMARKQLIKQISEIENKRRQIKDEISRSSADKLPELKKQDTTLQQLLGTRRRGQGSGLNQLNETFGMLQGVLQDADMPPSKMVIEAVNKAKNDLKETMKNQVSY